MNCALSCTFYDTRILDFYSCKIRAGKQKIQHFNGKSIQKMWRNARIDWPISCYNNTPFSQHSNIHFMLAANCAMAKSLICWWYYYMGRKNDGIPNFVNEFCLNGKMYFSVNENGPFISELFWVFATINYEMLWTLAT